MGGNRENTRQRILEVAQDLISRHGFAGTSTRELSEQLGFTKAALYYYFRTKDDLLAALIAPVVDDLRDLLARHPGDGVAIRRSLLADYVDLVVGHRSLIQAFAHDPSVKEHAAQSEPQLLYDRLTDRLAGADDPGAADRARVRFVLGGIHAAVLHAEPRAQQEAVREAVIRAACGALGIPAPRRPAALSGAAGCASAR